MVRIYTWIRKYRPRKLKEFVNQKEAVEQVLKLVENYKPGGKAILLYGPPGCGKTSLAYAIAGELGLELVEINASDMRDAKTLRAVIGEAMKQKSFFHKGKIILIDEIDGMSGTYDRGGIQELGRLINNSRYPVILTANDPWDQKFRDIRKVSVMVNIPRLNSRDIKKKLLEIARKEGLRVDDEAISMLARNSSGDLRAAINDLETLSRGSRHITLQDVKSLGWRERETEIFEALGRILKSTSIDTSIGAFDYVDMDLNEAMLWLEKNIPKEYKNIDDLARAMDALSIADIYMGRITRRQYYRLMVYASLFMTSGVALAKREKYPGFTKMDKPTRILKIWMANQKNEKKKQLAEIMARRMHTSKRVAYRDVLPFIIPLLRDKQQRERLAKWLRIDEALLDIA